MRRMSILPISEKCGKAAELSAQHGAGRAAAMSQAFHATCAGKENARYLMAALSSSERDEVNLWKMPEPVEVLDSVTLDYEDAVKELEIALDVWGDYTADLSEAVSVGHLDFAWVREIHGVKVAFIADIKKSIWTTPDGPDSLQLHAYGWAFAKMSGCAAYCTGIWAAEEGEWIWSLDMVTLNSPMGRAMLSRIMYAAQHEGEYSFGDHCGQCYARLHCPEYFITPAAAATELAPFAVDKLAVSADLARKLLADCKRAEEFAEVVRKEIQELVRHGKLTITDTDGKIYGRVECKGREGVDIAKVRELHPELLKKGAPFDRFQFLKPKRKAS
jgi:hypothetical protein